MNNQKFKFVIVLSFFANFIIFVFISILSNPIVEQTKEIILESTEITQSFNIFNWDLNEALTLLENTIFSINVLFISILLSHILSKIFEGKIDSNVSFKDIVRFRWICRILFLALSIIVMILTNKLTYYLFIPSLLLNFSSSCGLIKMFKSSKGYWSL